MARWRAIADTSFEKSILKIIGGEVASTSKQTLFDEYEFEIPSWRGGEPLLTLALKKYFFTFYCQPLQSSGEILIAKTSK